MPGCKESAADNWAGGGLLRIVIVSQERDPHAAHGQCETNTVNERAAKGQ